jgi:hypothetical protein
MDADVLVTRVSPLLSVTDVRALRAVSRGWQAVIDTALLPFKSALARSPHTSACACFFGLIASERDPDDHLSSFTLSAHSRPWDTHHNHAARGSRLTLPAARYLVSYVLTPSVIETDVQGFELQSRMHTQQFVRHTAVCVLHACALSSVDDVRWLFSKPEFAPLVKQITEGPLQTLFRPSEWCLACVSSHATVLDYFLLPLGESLATMYGDCAGLLDAMLLECCRHGFLDSARHVYALSRSLSSFSLIREDTLLQTFVDGCVNQHFDICRWAMEEFALDALEANSPMPMQPVDPFFDPAPGNGAASGLLLHAVVTRLFECACDFAWLPVAQFLACEHATRIDPDMRSEWLGLCCSGYGRGGNVAFVDWLCRHFDLHHTASLTDDIFPAFKLACACEQPGVAQYLAAQFPITKRQALDAFRGLASSQVLTRAGDAPVTSPDIAAWLVDHFRLSKEDLFARPSSDESPELERSCFEMACEGQNDPIAMFLLTRFGGSQKDALAFLQAALPRHREEVLDWIVKNCTFARADIVATFVAAVNTHLLYMRSPKPPAGDLIYTDFPLPSSRRQNQLVGHRLPLGLNIDVGQDSPRPMVAAVEWLLMKFDLQKQDLVKYCKPDAADRKQVRKEHARNEKTTVRKKKEQQQTLQLLRKEQQQQRHRHQPQQQRQQQQQPQQPPAKSAKQRASSSDGEGVTGGRLLGCRNNSNTTTTTSFDLCATVCSLVVFSGGFSMARVLVNHFKITRKTMARSGMDVVDLVKKMEGESAANRAASLFGLNISGAEEGGMDDDDNEDGDGGDSSPEVGGAEGAD